MLYTYIPLIFTPFPYPIFPIYIKFIKIGFITPLSVSAYLFTAEIASLRLLLGSQNCKKAE